jgi:hypothetical protein
MQPNNQDMQGKDPELWELAKKRVDFRSHLMTYLVMVPFFWLVWWFTGGDNNDGNGFPWAVWPTLGWGIGVFFHYLGVYVFESRNQVEREYDKLQREKNLK